MALGDASTSLIRLCVGSSQLGTTGHVQEYRLTVYLPPSRADQACATRRSALSSMLPTEAERVQRFVRASEQFAKAVSLRMLELAEPGANRDEEIHSKLRKLLGDVLRLASQ